MIRRDIAARLAFAFVVLFTFTSNASAAEPAWCNPDTFSRYERGNNIPYLEREHVYQIGALTLAGLAVGDSDYRYVQSLADQYTNTEAYEKSCTFYFHEKNEDAVKAFNHKYVSNPMLKGTSAAKEFEQKINPLFLEGNVNFMSCAERHGYVAMGCQGMKHRGPSVFAMFLSFSGCTPEHSTKIANKVWGNNFVLTKTRTAIARKGYELGNAKPAERARLQKLMSTR
ncbi:MAG: hypothetical protein V4760_07000 [Bdellovibrionota bacterium]